MTAILDRLRAHGRADDGGFTVVEVVVASVIFAIVAIAAIAGVTSAVKSSHSTQQRVQAADAAQQDIAQAVAAYQAGTMPSSTNYTATAGSESFAVHRTVAFVGTATACSTGTSFTVHVEVRQKQTDDFLAQSDTVVAC